ncbi:MAG TPA: histidine kinase [Casimicrobiaceae bacterium]|nr:histidine kinase [Casimicrobiaceae bacterium]
MSSSAASVPEPASAQRHAPWLAGLTWKGATLLAVPCLLNAVRRNSIWVVEGTFADWLRNFAQALVSGLCLAAVVTLAVIVTYNQAPSRWRSPALVAAVLVSSFVGTLMLFAIETVGTFDLDELGGFGWAVVGTWPRYALLALLLTAVFVHVRTADESEAATRRAELDRARAGRQMDEARLQVLQAQIEPHFLFNTLANVRRFYAKDPAGGESMLGNLMNYLAVALPQMRAADSTLEREAALTEAYLAVQRIRMGRRLAFDIDIAEPLRAARLPPMMLLTLAENAIKHGLAPLPEGGHVRVSADVVGGRMRVRVADSGGGFGESSGAGTGLANIRARLDTLYGPAAELTIERNEPRGVVATIVLPHVVPEPEGAA